jgi:hypothetical protein
VGNLGRKFGDDPAAPRFVRTVRGVSNCLCSSRSADAKMRVGPVRRGGVAKISPTANEYLAFNSELCTEKVWFLADALNADLDEVTVSVEPLPRNRITNSLIICCAPAPTPGSAGTSPAAATETR